MPLAMRTTRYVRPAIEPLNVTTPVATARTGSPATVAYSIPRFPGHHMHAASRNGSATGAGTGGRQHGAANTARSGVDHHSNTTKNAIRRTRTSFVTIGSTEVVVGVSDHTIERRAPPRELGGRNGQPTPAAPRRDLRCSTDFVWICDTRLSVTPSTW